MRYRIIGSQLEFLFLVIFGFLITTRTSLCDSNTATNHSSGISLTKLNDNVAPSPIFPGVDSRVPNTTQKNQNNPHHGEEPESTEIKTKNVGDRVAVEGKNEKLPTTEPVVPVFPSSSNLNTGALRRASYVFLGLSVLVVAYFMFRSSRLKTSPAQMVRKYGILAHRQDVEMRPLPLDEDDEDDTTVFDISGFSPQKPLQLSS